MNSAIPPSAPALTPDTPIQYARGVGPVRVGHLSALGITTCADLLTYYPRDYLRYSGEISITDMRPGEMVTVRGTLLQTRLIRRRPTRFEALLDDGTARCVLTWFNPYGLSDKLHPGLHIRAVGKVTSFRNRAQMVQPRFEILGEEKDAEDAARSGPKIEPVYSATEELPSPIIARIIGSNLDALLNHVQEFFPPAHLGERNMLTLRSATDTIHRPASLPSADKARRTLAYHEFFLHQLAIAIKRYHHRTGQPAIPLRTDDAVNQRIRALFEFPLTAAQDRVIDQLRKDLAASRPMNRLLQGDVGSGKTVVALYAMLCAAATPRAENEPSRDRQGATSAPAMSGGQISSSAGITSFAGHQAALMAPTEILAEQHFLTLQRYLDGKKVKIGLLVGNLPARERQATLAALANGSLGLVVGTHALLTEDVRFKSLALIVIDEQHKFGVEQRSIIRSRHGNPHTLVMTATPIPRTLAMTAFGDLDVSTIDQLPPGRHPIQTRMTVSANRESVYHFVATHLKAGEQAYVVLPTIDSDEGGGGDSELRSVTAVQKELQEGGGWLRNFRVGLIHGRMDYQLRSHIMERFRQGLIDVLVATTVIEVGVDVPNATIMVIEHADRFGLSQLHQLRGRVGRAGKKSFCILIADQTTDDSISRCQAMVKHSSGFKIAEEDLRLRGMGQLIGTAQSGRTDMHFPDLLFDTDLLMLARRDALNTIAADPRLLDPTHTTLRKEVLTKFGQTISLADVG